MRDGIKRGDIFFADFNPARGSEQGGVRPCVNVQNDMGNAHSPTIVVLPFTTKLQKGRLPTHVHVPQTCGLDAGSLALAEQIRTIDRSRLGNYVGRIGLDEQSAIDRALFVSMGLRCSFCGLGKDLLDRKVS